MSEPDLPSDEPQIDLPEAADEEMEVASFEATPAPEIPYAEAGTGPGTEADEDQYKDSLDNLLAKLVRHNSDVDARLALIWANLFNAESSGGTGAGEVRACLLSTDGGAAGTDGSVDCGFTYTVKTKDNVTTVATGLSPVNDRLKNTQYTSATRGIYWVHPDTTVYLYAFEKKTNAGYSTSGESTYGEVSYDTSGHALTQKKYTEVWADGRRISKTADTDKPINTSTGSCT